MYEVSPDALPRAINKSGLACRRRYFAPTGKIVAGFGVVNVHGKSFSPVVDPSLDSDLETSKTYPTLGVLGIANYLLHGRSTFSRPHPNALYS